VNREIQESVDISGHFLQLSSNSNYGTQNQHKHIKQSMLCSWLHLWTKPVQFVYSHQILKLNEHF